MGKGQGEGAQIDWPSVLGAIGLPATLLLVWLRQPYLAANGFGEYPAPGVPPFERIAFLAVFAFLTLGLGLFFLVLIGRSKHGYVGLLVFAAVGSVGLSPGAVGLSWSVTAGITIASMVICLPLGLAFWFETDIRMRLGRFLASILSVAVAGYNFSVFATGHVPRFLGGYQRHSAYLREVDPKTNLPIGAREEFILVLEEGGYAWITYQRPGGARGVWQGPTEKLSSREESNGDLWSPYSLKWKAIEPSR